MESGRGGAPEKGVSSPDAARRFALLDVSPTARSAAQATLNLKTPNRIINIHIYISIHIYTYIHIYVYIYIYIDVFRYVYIYIYIYISVYI